MKMLNKRIVLALFACVLCAQVVFADNAIFDTTTGRVSCPLDAAKGIVTCKGIPYGESTAGPGRFQPPVPKKPWSGTFEANKWGHGCISLRTGIDTSPDPSEDCLNLNVFAPAKPSTDGAYPVMVWIYGGGFQEGMAEGPLEIYDASYYASVHQVVVVSLNYRLGVYGFLVTDEIRGNMGILDQRLALQWVQSNIAKFSGDPKRVTIFGESAGAMSVGLHIMSPGSRGLFKQAIIQSNPVGLRYMTADRAAIVGREFCRQAQCLNAAGQCDTKCIQLADPEVVAHASKAATGNLTVYWEANHDHLLDGILGFKPTLDGDDFPMQILDYLSSPRFAQDHPDIRVMVGSTSDEAVPFVAPKKMPDKPLPMSLYSIVMPLMLGAERGTTVSLYYTPKYKDALLAFIQTMTDLLFRCSSHHFAAATALVNGNSYVYHYAHVFSQTQLWQNFGFPELCEKAVCHTAELPFVFYKTNATSVNPPVTVQMTPEEQKFSRQIVQYWANFAHTGNPNYPGSAPTVEDTPFWPKYDNSTRQNIRLEAGNITTEDTVALCSMWDKVGYNVLVSNARRAMRLLEAASLKH